MFDMKRSTDRRQVLSVLGLILVLACIPAFLVLFTQLAGELLLSVLVGAALYFIFFRKNHQKEESENV